MDSQNLLNKQVVHKKYGVGQVVHAKGIHLQVQFDHNNEIKKFIYPDAFEQFITIENPDLMKQVSMDLISKRNQETEAENERNERYAKMDEELREMHKEAIKRRLKAASAKKR